MLPGGVLGYEVSDDGNLWALHSTMKVMVRTIPVAFAVQLLSRVEAVEKAMQRMLEEKENGPTEL